ncbi:hypothetical protein V1525DRAFT_10126 [Lipomyces kononenkoae]|uniref:Uncharacterized protein n=1 Tax=Lipomyces kononenkoae TaxID=34357 RepID=A0ACC3TBU7_LIPKO
MQVISCRRARQFIELLLAVLTITALCCVICNHSVGKRSFPHDHYYLRRGELPIDTTDSTVNLDAASFHREYHIPQTRVNHLSEFESLDKCTVLSEDVAAIGYTAPCIDKNALLDSLSSGGRIGLDAPYHSKGCQMWWYEAQELCNVWAKYSKVIFVGDDALEDVFASMAVLIRKDALNGAVRDSKENMDCTCERALMDRYSCQSVFIRSMNDFTDYDQSLAKCMPKVKLQMHYLPRYPVDPAAFNRFVMATIEDIELDRRPLAIIYGHGHGSLFDIGATASWISTLHDMVQNIIPYDGHVHELFVTPGATGPQVDSVDTLQLGLKASQLFEIAMRSWGREVNIDVLGTWNATVQTTFSEDGLHSGLRVNLLKAMMIANWLDLVNPGSD